MKRLSCNAVWQPSPLLVPSATMFLAAARGGGGRGAIRCMSGGGGLFDV